MTGVIIFIENKTKQIIKIFAVRAETITTHPAIQLVGMSFSQGILSGER